MPDIRPAPVSFGLIGTLLLRDVARHSDLLARMFGLARAVLGPETDFVTLRQRAESNARRALGGTPDLRANYSALHDLLPDTDSAAIDALMHAEMVAESESLCARALGLSLFARAQASGAPVLVISDSPLPRDLLMQVLQRSGFDGKFRLILSTEQPGLSKDDGSLWRWLTSGAVGDFSGLHHTGHDVRADVQMAGQAGLEATHLPQPVDALRVSTPWADLGLQIALRGSVVHLADGRARTSILPGQTMAQAAQQHFDRAPEGMTLSGTLGDDPVRTGAVLLGPVLAAFAYWLARIVARDGVSHLIFAGPAGPALARAWAAFCPGTPPGHDLLPAGATTAALMRAALPHWPQLPPGTAMVDTGLGALVQPTLAEAIGRPLSGYYLILPEAARTALGRASTEAWAGKFPPRRSNGSQALLWPALGALLHGLGAGSQGHSMASGALALVEAVSDRPPGPDEIDPDPEQATAMLRAFLSAPDPADRAFLINSGLLPQACAPATGGLIGRILRGR